MKKALIQNKADTDLLIQPLSWHKNQLHSDSLKEKLLELAQELIAVPSNSGDIEQSINILEVAKQRLSDHSFTPYVSNSFPSLLYSNQNTNKFKILLNAHLDVVPGEKNQYQPYVKDGKLYGRGAYDMKGAAAVMLLLFNELANVVSYPLGLQLVTEEELPNQDGTKYQIENGVRTEFAIMGECGSNLNIIHETKGVFKIKLTSKGYTAHGAYPWKGKNAIIRMYDALNSIYKHFPIPEKETNETTITVSQIKTSNNIWNKVPDDCFAILDVRYNKKDRKMLLEKLKAILPEDITIKLQNELVHHYTDPKSNFIQLLNDNVKDVLGEKTSIRNTHGGSDTTFFSQVGCDAIEFGPIGANQHKEDEWVDIKSLNDYYQILKNFLLSVK